ncbi:MAG: DUF4365 domain-containing protein, partial [Pedobacter sp.]
FIKAQIKTQQSVSIKSGKVSIPLKKSFLRYVYECRVPILLIVVSLDTEKSWYVWLQKWIIDSGNITNLYNDNASTTITVNIDEANDFASGLEREIIPISTWENGTQLYIALRDLANLSLRMYNSELSELLFGYLGKFRPSNIADEGYLNSLIEQIIELGNNLWATDQGNKVSQQLFNFIRNYGDRLTADHIAQIVIRGESYSRTGIIALGILYNEFQDHILSLNLIEKFKNFADPRVHYYCTIRERYLDLKSPGWLFEADLQVGKLKPDFTGVSIFDKWANRGDSMVLDYIVFSE